MRERFIGWEESMPEIEGIRIFLRQAQRNLTQREFAQALQWDRRVHRHVPYYGRERRGAA